jgi:hypothetical protein
LLLILCRLLLLGRARLAARRGRRSNFYVAYATFVRPESALPGLSRSARTLGSLFGSFGKTLIVLGDSQHRFLGLRLIHLIRDAARLFCAGSLMKDAGMSAPQAAA